MSVKTKVFSFFDTIATWVASAFSWMFKVPKVLTAPISWFESKKVELPKDKDLRAYVEEATRPKSWFDALCAAWAERSFWFKIGVISGVILCASLIGVFIGVPTLFALTALTLSLVLHSAFVSHHTIRVRHLQNLTQQSQTVQMEVHEFINEQKKVFDTHQVALKEGLGSLQQEIDVLHQGNVTLDKQVQKVEKSTDILVQIETEILDAVHTIHKGANEFSLTVHDIQHNAKQVSTTVEAFHEDVVHMGHTYQEYQEAVTQLAHAVTKMKVETILSHVQDGELNMHLKQKDLVERHIKHHKQAVETLKRGLYENQQKVVKPEKSADALLDAKHQLEESKNALRALDERMKQRKAAREQQSLALQALKASPIKTTDDDPEAHDVSTSASVPQPLLDKMTKVHEGIHSRNTLVDNVRTDLAHQEAEQPDAVIDQLSHELNKRAEQRRKIKEALQNQWGFYASISQPGRKALEHQHQQTSFRP